MKEDQLALLETRISSAIAFIEDLKSKEKKLLVEREELAQRAQTLEKSVQEKDKKIEELLRTQKYLKEKIETILTKLESLAGYSQANPAGVKPGAQAARPSGESASDAEGVIIEEKIVDLKEESRKERPQDSGSKSNPAGAGVSKPKQDGEKRPAKDEKSNTGSIFGKKQDEQFTGELFSNNPFVEI